MIATLGSHREGIIAALRGIDANEGPGLDEVNSWGEDLRGRLVEFTSRGKLIRGSLVAAAAEALGRAPDHAVYTAAAAVELVQSFLLIHDDIMDEDPIRRGVPAVYEQYRRHACDRGFRNPARFGESMGICGGDVAVLLAVSAIGGCELYGETRIRLITLLSREIAKVGVAQMADVANGHSPKAASEEEILAVYRYKTGRYTFSLPLMMGAIIAGADGDVIQALSTWGELEGMIFQIRDDHLGIMGDTDEIGKPTGSDISSNKQTLHRLHLLARLPESKWADVAAYFGHDQLSEGQVKRVREALVGTGTVALLESRVAALREEAAAALDRLALPPERRAVFDEIDAYNAARDV
ncbi:MAG: polyprenyl synthetase family protein [Spirochaetota bacterium]